MEYFHYEKDQLTKDPKIKVKVLGERGEVFYQIAEDMLEVITANNAASRRTVLIVPVGPVGHYPVFVRLVNERQVSLKNVWFINMDEYLTDNDRYIDINNKLSFRGFMQKTVYDKINPELVMPENQRIFPDPDDTGKISKLINELGGVDACFGGIGINGHIAFNEPENVSAEEFSQRDTRVLSITKETLAVNCIDDLNGAINAMPKRCVTIGMKEILTAKKIRLYCFKQWHTAVIRQAAFGEVSGNFPVTLLQNHPDTLITVPDYLSNKAF